MHRLIPALVALGLIAWSASPASAQTKSLEVTFDTSTTGNAQFNNQNTVAVWIEDSGGNFVRTIGRWAQTPNHMEYLYDWFAAAGGDGDNPDPDARLGATFNDYQTGLMVTWDLTDRSDTEVTDGVYTIRMELADRNSGSAAENNEGTFTFTKGAVDDIQVGQSSDGFNNVSITYRSGAIDPSLCGNDALDPGETCDGADCPTSCAETGDACMLSNLSGDAASCNAQCVVQNITACVDSDGCCPDGCAGSDNDCNVLVPVEGGCSIRGQGRGAGAGLLLLLALTAVFGRRRRRD